MFELILEITLNLGGISFRVSRNLYLRRGPGSFAQIAGRILGSYSSYFRSTMSGGDFVFGITDLSTMARRAFSAAADAVPQLLLVEAWLDSRNLILSF